MELISVIGLAVLRIFVVVVIVVFIFRLFFKDTIIYHIVAVMLFPIAIAVLVGALIGREVLPYFVAAPVALVSIVVGFAIIGNIIQKPLKEMVAKISFLSKGDLSFSFDKRFLKGKHELAEVSRKIIQLAEALKKTAIFADNVGNGNLNAEYELLGENDTMGKAMLEMRANLLNAEAEMEKNRKKEERRNWATQGLAKFAEILRCDNDNLETLSHSIISYLVKYLSANQGGIFVWNEEESVLEMTACYAFDRKKFVEKQVYLGEGLLGACYLEGEPIYMTNIPENYISITSGLGEANPRALSICPLKVNNKIYGVVELASFRIFEPFELEFIAKVSESIASTISTVKVSIRTSELLAQTKLQAEEMANQEEELRQNMEEMQATQEEMRRRETELGETLSKMREELAVSEARNQQQNDRP